MRSFLAENRADKHGAGSSGQSGVMFWFRRKKFVGS
jgi:hypothetical protein